MIVDDPQLRLLDTERSRIFDALSRNNGAYLVTLRSFARCIAYESDDGTVSIDELRERILAERFFMPADLHLDERIFGVVFRCRDFVAVGQRVTTRRSRVVRSGVGSSRITIYKLAPRKESTCESSV